MPSSINMTWETALLYCSKSVLLPPGINLAFLIIGLALLKKYPLGAHFLTSLSTITLLILSMPKTAGHLTQQVEPPSAIKATQLKSLKNNKKTNRAIVVLSEGRISISPEYGNIDTVSAHTLQRIQYASWLHKKTNLPVLLSGGSRLGEATSEAVLMNQVMAASFGVSPKWIESSSTNTMESAAYSSKILKTADIHEIILVTHAWHMQRAKSTFEQYNLIVIPAATGFQSRNKPKHQWLLYLPSAKALHESSRAIGEMLGTLHQLR